MIAAMPLSRTDLDHVLEQTRAHWNRLQGKRLFVTGGTGFFGIWLLESFAHANDVLNLGAHLTVLTRDPAAFGVRAMHLYGRNDIDFVPGDIATFVYPPGLFDFVIHAATATTQSSSPLDSLDTFESIIAGARRALDFAVKAKTSAFLFTSSGAVYGRQPSDLSCVPESYLGAPDPLDLRSSYGEGKRAAELLCSAYAAKHGFSARIARCFAFVGPHLPLSKNFAIGNFIRDGLRGGPIRVNSDGQSYRSYLYASDLAVWLWTILLQDSTSAVFNVGSESSYSVRQVAELVANRLDCDVELATPNSANPFPPNSRYVPDTRKAQTELGLRARVPLPEAIDKTVTWYHTASSYESLRLHS